MAKRRFITRRKLAKQALLSARRTPAVSDGLAYKVSIDTGDDHLELFAAHPYAAVMAAEALSDKFHAQSHVMLGNRGVSTVEPRQRRRKI